MRVAKGRASLFQPSGLRLRCAVWISELLTLTTSLLEGMFVYLDHAHFISNTDLFHDDGGLAAIY